MSPVSPGVAPTCCPLQASCPPYTLALSQAPSPKLRSTGHVDQGPAGAGVLGVPEAEAAELQVTSSSVVHLVRHRELGHREKEVAVQKLHLDPRSPTSGKGER